jgi:hypothetical protein
MDSSFQTAMNNLDWPSDTDTCVVTRYDKTGTTWGKAVAYSGGCDFQSGSGTLTYNEGGNVVQGDARCFLNGYVDIRLDDECVFNGNADLTFTVVQSNTWTMAPQHTSLLLKRGAIAYTGRT